MAAESLPQAPLPALGAGEGDHLPVPAGMMTGAAKAAVLMAALGSERAANVMQRLADKEIESVSAEIVRLTAVRAETTRSIFTELAVAAQGDAEPAVNGGIEFAREVIERAIGPERAAGLLGRLAGGRSSAPFEFLRRVPAERVARLLRGESAQTVALVVANLPPGLAAEVLSELPTGEQPQVAKRIATMGDASTAVIEQVEEVIRSKLGTTEVQSSVSAGGAKALAEILNHAGRGTERNVLENLATTDGELAAEVRAMLFVFEDIAKLDERAVQQVLRDVDQKDLALALRGAADNVMEVVLTNMSERGAAMLKEEMEIQPPQKKRDIDEAQSRIVAVVRRLEEAGSIVIGRGEGGETEDEEVV